ncbi:glutamine amidotransferase-like class 1 domain-containing protein 1 isoform X1 [Ptychodera flava]|uniref:glutamine amidotransferase-like class 1 domain-containing protein 1 isoform X1 n=2 Tax=Ptychodera flava TaxID=63121 RepID=UPI003969BD9B
MSAPKTSCLIVASSAQEGVSAQSFIHAFTLTHSAFSVQVATPNGRGIEYVGQDDNSRRWLNEFRTKPFANPTSLQSIDASRYSVLLIPSCPGALHDLASDTVLAQILDHFMAEKKPICAVGFGVGALCCTKREPSLPWNFASYCMTAPSVFELARGPDLSTMPIILEDYIKDAGANYSASEPDAVHVVVDRHLITGQNEQSTLTAVQNLILLSNARQSKLAGK